MSASEAVSLGLADSIIEPKKRGNLRKKRWSAMKKELDPKDLNKLIKDIYLRINKVKFPKIELNQVKEELADPNIIIDNDTVETKKAE